MTIGIASFNITIKTYVLRAVIFFVFQSSHISIQIWKTWSVLPFFLDALWKNVIFLFTYCSGWFLCCICSKATGSAAFVGLSWTCLLVSSVFSAPEKREGPTWKKMVSENALSFFFLFSLWQMALFKHFINRICSHETRAIYQETWSTNWV